MSAVPAGYKRTEVGVIPKDWDVLSIGQIAECFIGLTYSPNDVKESGKLVLRSSNVQANRLAFNDNVYVEMDIPPRAITKENDILICVRNGSRQLIGKAALIDKATAGSAFGAFMAVLRSDTSEFLFQQFQSNILKRQINDGMGATINQITNKDMASYQVIWPRETSEQQAIAKALTDADAFIESLEQLLVKKRNIKQGAMQELLSGKRRLAGFEGEWVVKALGQIGVFLKGSGVKKDEAHSGDLPCIRYGEIYTQHNDYVKKFHSQISLQVAALATKLKKGDLLFAGSGETKTEIGKCVAFVSDFDAYAGGDIVILRSSVTDAMFMGYYCNTAAFAIQKASKGQGDAIVHISANALSTIQICLPSITEQTAIATILFDMDAEIDALQAKLDKACSLKQGMMQQLLTGKIRL